MVPSFDPLPSAGWRSKLVFVASAALAALLLRVAWDRPLTALVALVAVAAMFGGRLLFRWRLRRAMQRGDVRGVLARFAGRMQSAPHAETMGPLMTATALAAYGWTARAREVLRTAARGPAWEAAIEHRLFLDVLLLTFEGAPDEALPIARRLEGLPLPDATPALAVRVQLLRAAVAALARAFAHRPEAGDRARLLQAGHASPLVHWAMRYGAAIIDVDGGELGHARTLLAGAPAWPIESCFAGFHREIAAELARRAASPGEPQSADASTTPGDAGLDQKD